MNCTGGLKARYEDICARMERAAGRAARKLSDITLLAVTKKVAFPVIREAIELGLGDFGENYFQEGREKILNLGHEVRWHFIGHLQKNKAKQVVELFDLIQGVDSLDLAEKLDSAGEKAGKPVSILLEVRYGEEGTKSGILPVGLVPLMEALAPLKWIKVKGLMTIPPFYEEPGRNRVNFASLRDSFTRLTEMAFPTWEGMHLSMGMSDDFEIAIEEGSTMVRIGRALFGERQ
jgi:PLP dependent protein